MVIILFLSGFLIFFTFIVLILFILLSSNQSPVNISAENREIEEIEEIEEIQTVVEKKSEGGVEIEDIPIYCISCKDDKERRSLTQKRFDEQHIPFEFFDAVDGRELSMNDFQQEGVLFGNETDVGARGCALSHKRIWEFQVEYEIPYIFVTEDDVLFHKDYHQLISTFNLPEDAGIFYVGHCGHIDDEHIKEDEIIEVYPMCSHAYIIRLDAAKLLLKKFYCDLPIDIFIAETYKKLKKSLMKRVDWKIYAFYNGKSHSELEDGSDGCKFRGLIYQDRDMKRAIHRHMNECK